MKTYWSQRDSRFKNVKLGFGNTTIYSHGCFCVSLANLSGIDPIEVNEILKKGGFFSGDLIISSVSMAKSLGLEYHGKVDTREKPNYRTIAEVDMSPAPGKQMHFVIVKEDGSIIDPWTGTIRPKGTYPIVSYRLFKKPEEPKELPKETPKDEAPQSPVVNEKPETPSMPTPEPETPQNANLEPIKTYQEYSETGEPWKQTITDIVSMIINLFEKIWNKLKKF